MTLESRKHHAQVHALELLAALEALLHKIDSMTSEQFSRGEDRPERERARAVLNKIHNADPLSVRSLAASLMGQARSDRKAATSRANGARPTAPGKHRGRPRKSS